MPHITFSPDIAAKPVTGPSAWTTSSLQTLDCQRIPTPPDVVD